jgi:hypothetical protein
LQAVLDGLHEPRTNVYRERLRRAVRRLDFTVDVIERDRLKGRRVTFSGEFVLETSSGPHLVPFGGSYETGAAASADKLVQGAVAAMRAGALPVRYKRGSPEEVGVKLALETLGVHPGRFSLRSCEDSRLFQLGMAALFPRPAAGEDPARLRTVAQLADDPQFVEDFGDIGRLAQRMKHVYDTRHHPRWLEPDAAVIEVDSMITSIAASRGWHGPPSPRPTYGSAQLEVLRRRLKQDAYKRHAWSWNRAGGPQLSPCKHCGSPWLVPLRIHEVAGYLCLECRRDALGIRWPERFNRFARRITAWQAVEAPLVIPAPGHLHGGQSERRRLRRADELEPAEREALVAAYVKGEVKVADIAQDAAISAASLLQLVKDAGVPTRYGATGRRWCAAEAAAGKPTIDP